MQHNASTNEVIGRNLRLARISKGLTQKQFANKLCEYGFKCGSDAISNYERGKRNFNPEFISAAAAILECSDASLIGHSFGKIKPDADLEKSLRQAATLIEKLIDN